MLTYINIKNFAIIKDLELDLQSEMTAITGETGAGKSIIIDSLELVLGARVDASMVKDGEGHSEIVAMFDLTNIPSACEWLIEKELDSENECIIRRVISSEGRSKSTINGVPCTQQTLRILSDFLLSIHGQHENQTLLNNEYQRELLDAFADNRGLAGDVKKAYKDWLKAKKDLIELENLTIDHQTKLDFLNYQLEELESVDAGIENLENLRDLQKKLSGTKQFLTNVNSSLDVMTESDNSSVISNLYQVRSQLEECRDVDSEVCVSIDLVNNAIIQVEEAVSSLRQNLNNLELNEDRQEQIEEELDKIYTLARKHQVQPDELSEVKSSLFEQLEKIQGATLKLEEIKEKVTEAEERYLAFAKKLSSKREAAAGKLEKRIVEKMQSLGMKGGKFIVGLLSNSNQSFSANGLERVEFLVSANPGFPAEPLNKIASGGELSRISLAIQVITAEKEVTPTLIFDEIDTGIGGETANIVGRLLRKLAENAQVVCITHLPQIASCGHNHILIEKKSTHKKTEIGLTTLDRNERIEEIARMLGGVRLTKESRNNAKEMLNCVV